MSEKGRQFSSRFWEPYDELILEKARAARVKPNQLVRIATMAFVDQDLLALHEQLRRTSEELKELREQQATLLRFLVGTNPSRNTDGTFIDRQEIGSGNHADY